MPRSMTSPEAFLTMMSARTTSSALERWTSAKICSSWPDWASICSSWFASMPYCWDSWVT